MYFLNDTLCIHSYLNKYHVTNTSQIKTQSMFSLSITIPRYLFVYKHIFAYIGYHIYSCQYKITQCLQPEKLSLVFIKQSKTIIKTTPINYRMVRVYSGGHCNISSGEPHEMPNLYFSA